jgi:hypothetical protein
MKGECLPIIGLLIVPWPISHASHSPDHPEVGPCHFGRFEPSPGGLPCPADGVIIRVKSMTEMLPQPPPDAPPPPPSEAALRSQKWWNWMLNVGFGSILLLTIAGLTTPMVIRSSKKSDLTEAISNARQIGLALYCPAPDGTSELTR